MRALGLALLMHVLLLGFLWTGISWQNVTPVAVEAEIWSPVARSAAPPPEPTPEPAPAPEPVKPEPVKPPPKAVAEPEPVKNRQPDPDIALEKEKKRKELEKKLAEEKERKELAKKELEKKELEKKELEKKRLAEEQEKKQLAEQEKKKLAEEQKRKQDEAAAEEKRKQAEEQQRKQEEQQAEQRRKKQREDDLKRLQAQAGDGVSGDAERASAPKISKAYAQIIGNKIKNATIMPPLTEISGNPAVEYAIELTPDGSVRDIRLLRPSGIPAFDQAVRRAIDKAAPYPADPETGKVPSSLVISHRPRDH